MNLNQGEDVTLDDGTKITFDGASEFANYQVSYDPFQNWVLASALVMLISLVGSLIIKRRRVYIRLRPNAAGGTDGKWAASPAPTAPAGPRSSTSSTERCSNCPTQTRSKKTSCIPMISTPT